MGRIRVLLTGPHWFGDLLPFCERGLREQGAEVLSFATQIHTQEMRRSTRVLDPIKRLPLVGERLERVARYQVEERRRGHFRAELAAGLERAAREFRPDLVLGLMYWSDLLRADMLSVFGNTPKVAWLMDDPFSYDGAMSELLLGYDAVYSVEGSWIDPVRLTTGRPVSLLTCGADLHTQFPVERARVAAEWRAPLAFVGTSYLGLGAGTLRFTLLDAVADLGLAIFGDAGWRRVPARVQRLAACYRRGPISTEEMNLVCNGADVALNIHHPQFRTGTSLRTFAICAAGAFQVVDWRPGLDRFYEPDAELVTYRSPEELREKAERYLAAPAERARIAEAGRRRTLAEHTYRHRLATILGDVGLGGRSVG